MRSSRYMNKSPQAQTPSLCSGPKGLGTAAARLGLAGNALGLRLRSLTHRPCQPAGPLKRPEFYMPFPVRASPYLDSARQRTTEWARRVGFLQTSAGVPVPNIWNEQKLAAYRFSLLRVDDPSGCYRTRTRDLIGVADLGNLWRRLLPQGVRSDPQYGRGKDLSAETRAVHAGRRWDSSSSPAGKPGRGRVWQISGPVRRRTYPLRSGTDCAQPFKP